MLSFFSGSVSNLSVEIIKEFEGFLGLFINQDNMKILDLNAIRELKTLIFNGAASSKEKQSS